MNILKGILADRKKHYQDVKKKIDQKLLKLPKGSITEIGRCPLLLFLLSQHYFIITEALN